MQSRKVIQKLVHLALAANSTGSFVSNLKRGAAQGWLSDSRKKQSKVESETIKESPPSTERAFIIKHPLSTQPSLECHVDFGCSTLDQDL
jgi:hypothetical protein